MSTSAPALPAPVSDDPTIDFVGLFADQTEDLILARWREWANEGRDPVADADAWTDTREGGHWFMATMPAIRECARLYDLMGTEVPMAAFVLWAWGTYLDDLAAGYGISRLPATPAVGTETFSGPVGTQIAQGTNVATVPTSADDDTPEFAVQQTVAIPAGGSVNVAIQAAEPGAAGNVAANAITAPSTPLPAGVTFFNAAATTGGTDPETDDALRTRVLEAMIAGGGANVAAYMKWAGQWPGVGAVQVVAAYNGPNGVLVMVTDPNGQPLPAAVVSALQAALDPVAGKGSGLAPVGAQVTVATSTAHNIGVSAHVTWKQGYSADGSSGTLAQGAALAQAIKQYLLTIPPGGSVRQAHVAGIIATWGGVDNVTNVLLNGAAADIALGTTPPESAQLTGGAVTFT